MKVIFSIKFNIVGSDIVSHRMLITILDYDVPTISHVIFFFGTGALPSLWHKTYVIPLPKTIENTKVTVLILVDFLNAFNIVNHSILLTIFSHIMISSKALEWF